MATTAQYQFWDNSIPVLFLGDWCKNPQAKNIWENPKHSFLPNTFSDKDRIEHYKYSIRVYNFILPSLVDWLNDVHKTSFSLAYWQIIIGPFLLLYIQALYSRYIHLLAAYHLYPQLYTYGLFKNHFLTPINTNEFYLLASESDNWNLQLFTQLLTFMGKSITKFDSYHWQEELQRREELKELIPQYRIITKLKLGLIKLIAKWYNKKSVGICFTEFSHTNMLSLMVKSKFKIFPVYALKNDPEEKLRNYKINTDIRSGLLKLPYNDNFTKVLLQTLVVNMPMNFIEYYKDIAVHCRRSMPYNPGVIINPGIMRDQEKFWAAENSENGSKLFSNQHGGGYGEIEYASHEWLERNNYNGFITWGWKEDVNTIPAPSIFICERQHEFIKLKSKKLTRNSLILWSANENIRYPIAYESTDIEYMRHSYFDNQAVFLASLNNEILPRIMMRLRPKSKYFKFVQKKLPMLEIQLPQGRETFFELLAEAAILIVDNINTTFKYGLAFNIPTILFWDEKLNLYRNLAKPHFDSLKEAGICYSCPIQAAKKINEIANNPHDWWNSHKVQAARRAYCKEFALYSSNFVDEWYQLLSNLSDAGIAHHKAISS